MPIDASIYGQFAPRVQSPQDVQNGLTQGAATGLALQNQRLQVQQQQNVMQQRNGLAQAMQAGQYDLANPAHQAQMVAQFPDVAPALLKTVNEGTQSAAKAKLDMSQAAKADAEVPGITLKQATDRTAALAARWGSVQKPEDVVRLYEQAVKDKLLTREEAYDEIKAVPTDGTFGAYAKAQFANGKNVAQQMLELHQQQQLASEEKRAAATLAQTASHNQATESNARGMLGVAQGRLALERQTSGIPAGFEADPAAPPGIRQLRPIAGGPHDPNGGGGQGSRAEMMFNRVTAAGNEASAALKNLAEMPVSASTGLFGTAQPGTSLLGSAKSVLAQKMNPQEVQDTKVMFAGVTRALGAIETSGLQVNGSLMHSMEAIVFNDGDTHMTKLRKMAEVRQIVEKGLEPNLSNPRIPDEQKALVRKIISEVQTAVPYTHSDITKLQQSANPRATVSDYAKGRGLPAAPSGGVPPEIADILKKHGAK